MKRLLTVIVLSTMASSIMGSAAMAQTTTAPAGTNTAPMGTTTAPMRNTAPAGTDTSNNAVSTSSANNTAKPASGSNSFTEAQARSRIESQGYTQVSGLALDANGVWRGTGMKNSAKHDVAVDYQGNVFGG